MRSFLFILFSIVFASFFQGCQSVDSSTNKSAFFGGEIINPTTNYVLFYKQQAQNNADTIFLDKYNRFAYKVDSIKENLYYFKHNRESQIVLLKESDSILLRLNTIEFDESLVFSGTGAKKNNFLIDIFLDNEKERALMKEYSKLSAIDFKRSQDSLLQLRFDRFNKFIKKNSLSNYTINTLKSSFLYEYNTRFEMYLKMHYGTITDIEAIKKNLPISFYEYRKHVNFNDSTLIRSYAYSRFINNYIINKTYVDFAKGQPDSKTAFEKTMYQLNLIDTLIKEPVLRNLYLKHKSYHYIKKNNNANLSKLVLASFLEKSTNSVHKNYLRKITYTANRLIPGNDFPDQNLIDINNQVKPISNLYKKPITALYFWSVNNPFKFKRIHNKIAHLRSKYPNIDFIGINISKKQSKNWKHAIKRYNYNPDYEFTFENRDCSLEEILFSDTNKIVLINKEGIIINANAELTGDLEKQFQ